MACVARSVGVGRVRRLAMTLFHPLPFSFSRFLFLGRCSSERVKIIDARLAAAFRDVLRRQTISLVYSRPLSSRRYEPHSYTALSSVVTGARALANLETTLPGTLFPFPTFARPSFTFSFTFFPSPLLVVESANCRRPRTIDRSSSLRIFVSRKSN